MKVIFKYKFYLIINVLYFKSPSSDYLDTSSINKSSNNVTSLGDISASSVRVDTIAFRPPPSPSLSPRRYCGEPADIIGNVDGHSCCIIM